MSHWKGRSFCIILLINFFTATAQKKNTLFVTPAILVPTSFALQPGFQYWLTPKLAILGEMAVPVWKSKINFQKTKLFRASTEIKWQVKESYISYQFSSVFRRLVDNDPGEFSQERYDSIRYRYTSAVIESPLIVHTLKLGNEYKMGEKKCFLMYFLV